MQPPEKYHPSFLTYEELKDSDMEISRDGGKTWERCYKEVDT